MMDQRCGAAKQKESFEEFARRHGGDEIGQCLSER